MKAHERLTILYFLFIFHSFPNTPYYLKYKKRSKLIEHVRRGYIYFFPRIVVNTSQVQIWSTFGWGSNRWVSMETDRHENKHKKKKNQLTSLFISSLIFLSFRDISFPLSPTSCCVSLLPFPNTLLHLVSSNQFSLFFSSTISSLKGEHRTAGTGSQTELGKDD